MVKGEASLARSSLDPGGSEVLCVYGAHVPLVRVAMVRENPSGRQEGQAYGHE